MIDPREYYKSGVTEFPESCYRHAFLLFEQEQFEDSINTLAAVLKSRASVVSDTTVPTYSCWTLIALNLQQLGKHDQALEIIQWLEECLSEDEFPRDASFVRWVIELARGRFGEVLESVNSVLSDCISDRKLDISDLLLCRGYAEFSLGNYSTAIFDFETGYFVSSLEGLRWLQAEHANYVGVVYTQFADYENALGWHQRALGIAEDIGSPCRVGRALLNVGISSYKLGDYSMALQSLESAHNRLDQAGNRPNLTRTQIALGNVHRLTRDFPAARQHLTQAYTMATDLKIPREECLALEFLGDVFRDEGKPEEARRYYQRGMAIAQDIAPEGDLVMELLRREGECLVKEGKAGAGLEILIKARAHAKKLGDRFEEGVVLRCLAEGLLAVGDLKQALDYSAQAAAQLEDIQARHEHAIARITAAEILLQQSEQPETKEPRDTLDQAWEQGLIAQGICRQLAIEYWTGVVRNLQSRVARRRAEELRYASAKERPRQATGDRYEPGDVIIAESRAMQEVMQAIEAFSPYDEPILLTGETGTGKEVVARRVHQMSLRKDKPFIAVNVTAIPQTMFEREFFGHVKGAFSGADHDRTGLAAEADGGTLFLDEIGDLPPTTQAKFLRILQDGSYHCLGDPVERRADLRVIAATNADLETDVRSGRFREDLYYRLAILEIPLSPLRDRPEDITPLLDHFLSLSAGRQVTAARYFNDLSLRLLANYGWPGNVREVALVARRAHISMQRLNRVEIEVGSGVDAMVLCGPGQAAAQAAAGAVAASVGDADSLSRARILLALEETGGNRAAAARLLGVARATLYRRLAKLGLD